ncbi:MAG TPA: prepilin-type N-terminal cleavage/methylation domain-containing protein [Desulfatiglandales bacterium]|nr:prepilin-type N-terminal cleavage/methylation domain-containing protein [Desulfatiglandales bacterium]
MLSRLHRKEGFTLIELMIVIAIIGILAAIAIPQFSAYRTRSYNSAAQSDLRNMATAEEAYYVDFSSYTGNETTLADGTYGYRQTTYVTIVADGTITDYTISAYHTSGDKTYTMQGPGGTVTAS